MSRTLLVQGTKTFRITIPDGAKLTFGPWSPSNGDKSTRYDNSDKALNGTLRVYENASTGASVLAVFSGVTGYRDTSIDYEEQAIVEQGSTVWRSDSKGYRREDVVKRDTDWVNPAAPVAIGPGTDEATPDDDIPF